MIAGHHNPGAAAEPVRRNRNPLAGVLPGDPLTAREADLLAALGSQPGWKRRVNVAAAARTIGITRWHAWRLIGRARRKLGADTVAAAIETARRKQ